MTPRENQLRAFRFKGPEYIPISFNISSPCWQYYPNDALEDLMVSHPILFPGYCKGDFDPAGIKHAPWRIAGKPYTDSWGCVWETAEDGMTGAVTKHALADWQALDDFIPPDPAEHNGWGVLNWNKIAAGIANQRKNDKLTRASLRHGHTYLTMTYLRGYENLTYDMCDEKPELEKLIRMIETFNSELVKRYLELGVEVMSYPEDLGMQQGPMLSPEHFCKYIKPSYMRLMALAREKGVVVHMHSDGHIMDLMDDILECGVDVINLQDLVNGIDEIKKHLKGRVCIDLDIDRQQVTRFGSPNDVTGLIRESVEKLSSPEGGLCMMHGLYPGAPLENIRALMDAMEKYSGAE